MLHQDKIWFPRISTIINCLIHATKPIMRPTSNSLGIKLNQTKGSRRTRVIHSTRNCFHFHHALVIVWSKSWLTLSLHKLLHIAPLQLLGPVKWATCAMCWVSRVSSQSVYLHHSFIHSLNPLRRIDGSRKVCGVLVLLLKDFKILKIFPDFGS